MMVGGAGKLWNCQHFGILPFPLSCSLQRDVTKGWFIEYGSRNGTGIGSSKRGYMSSNTMLPASVPSAESQELEYTVHYSIKKSPVTSCTRSVTIPLSLTKTTNLLWQNNNLIWYDFHRIYGHAIITHKKHASYNYALLHKTEHLGSLPAFTPQLFLLSSLVSSTVLGQVHAFVWVTTTFFYKLTAHKPLGFKHNPHATLAHPIV